MMEPCETGKGAQAVNGMCHIVDGAQGKWIWACCQMSVEPDVQAVWLNPGERISSRISSIIVGNHNLTHLILHAFLNLAILK